MHVGIAMFATDYSMPPAELAVALEERGFESYWFPEHSHIPLSRDSDYPRGGELPKKYYDVMDPFVVMGAAAAVTTKLKIATGICLVPQRDTIQTAKSVSSIDQISNGRFLFGIGSGWNADEMKNHGTAFKTRNAKMGEQIAAMQSIWTETKPEYHGEFVDFDPVFSSPKPIQKPHPPILLGGQSDHTLRRVVEFCDGWIPVGPLDMTDGMARLRRVADEAGRDMATLSTTVFQMATLTKMVLQTTESDEAALQGYAEVGVNRVLMQVPTADRDSCLKTLDGFMPLLG